MGEHDDKIFLKRFSGILAGLVIVTILIIIISVGTDRLEPGDNPSRALLAAERVAPVAGVRTELPSPAAQAADEAFVEETPAEEAPAEEAFVEEAPAEEAPTEEAPTEEAPTDEALADITDEQVADQPVKASSGIDGAAIYVSACSACHVAGVAGAPVPGSDAWVERAANGVDSLVANAIAGVGPIMQPKGGRADLSDEEIRAVVEHMMSQ